MVPQIVIFPLLNGTTKFLNSEELGVINPGLVSITYSNLIIYIYVLLHTIPYIMRLVSGNIQRNPPVFDGQKLSFPVDFPKKTKPGPLDAEAKPTPKPQFWRPAPESRKAMPCALAPLVVESDEELGAWDSTLEYHGDLEKCQVVPEIVSWFCTNIGLWLIFPSW